MQRLIYPIHWGGNLVSKQAQGKKSVPVLRDGAKTRASSARTDCASAKKVTVLFRTDVNPK